MIIEWLFFSVLLLLLCSYLLYPLLAVLIGAGRVEQINDDLPAISLLVPAHDEESVIAAKIENFLSLDYPPERIELIVADDGSTDSTVAVVQQALSNRVRLINNNIRMGKAATMNRLADEAQHALLLFSDANVMFSRSAVRRLLVQLGNPKVGAVTGEVRLINSGNEFSSGEELYYQLERRIQGAESRIASVMGVDGGMYLIRRELFQPLPPDTILDDFLVSIRVMRAGRRVVYESAAKATESGTPSIEQEFSRRARIVAGAVQLLKRGQVPRLSQPMLWAQFISHKLIRWLSPLLLLALFVCNLSLLEKHYGYKLFLGLQLGVYLSFLTTWRISWLRKTTLGSILFYLGVSQTAIAVGLGRGVLNRQRVLWDKRSRSSMKVNSVADTENRNLPGDGSSDMIGKL